MTLDIRGGLKNTAINNSDYVVFEEMLSNAIDSYLIRRKTETNAPSFLVSFQINIAAANLLADQFDVEISCKDNGAGFGDDQVKAFITKDSTYKDQLQIPGIGKCKGAGRIQFFHHFEHFSLDSTFRSGDELRRRRLAVGPTEREISYDSFDVDAAPKMEVSTTIRVRGLKGHPASAEQRPARAAAPEVFAAAAVTAHLYTSFLQRLIVLRGLIGEFSIRITSAYKNEEDSDEIKGQDLPTPEETRSLPLLCTHGQQQPPPRELNVTRYSFPAAQFARFTHEVALCANSAVVLDLTRKYLKSSSDRATPIEGKFQLILVESSLLEETVNQQRDGFDIPAECGDSKTLSSEYSLEDIVASLDDYVYEIITPKNFDKLALVKSTEEKFGITRHMLDEANIKVHYGDTEENIARRVLKKFQDDIVADTSKLFSVKQELLKLDPRTEDFRERVNGLAWKYTSTVKKMDMTNLSQVVVRRSAMIEVLRYAVSKLLDCQQADGTRNDHERIIHNVFFPMNADSTDTQDHDIWLLNEEYQYFEYIASDKKLSSLVLPGGQKLFEPDVDESLEKLFAENNREHGAKRPDIAIFNEEGSAIIIEFKAPDVEIQDHINDLAQYARLLAAKSEGRIKRFYGYLIGNKLNHSRMPIGWTMFANKNGYYQTGPLQDPETGRRYGELYSELLMYDQFISRAELRLGVYKRKLNVNLD